MSNFGLADVAESLNVPVMDYPSADAGSQRHVKHRAVALAGPEVGFGECRQVAVVLHRNRKVELFFECGCDGQPLPAYLLIPMSAAIFVGLAWKHLNLKGAVLAVSLGLGAGMVGVSLATRPAATEKVHGHVFGWPSEPWKGTSDLRTWTGLLVVAVLCLWWIFR